MRESGFDNVYIKNVFVIDLTQMFGEGKEPSTVEEFEALFPNDYYDYDEGSMLNFTGVGLRSVYGSKSSTAKFDVSAILDNGVQVFPDGLRRAGDVYDEIKTENGVTKAIKRIGSVDLGTLSWNMSSSFANSFYVSNLLPTQNCIIPKYDYLGTQLTTILTNNDKVAIREANNAFWIKDSTYTTVTTFKASLSGVMLYYESATPEEYILDDITLPEHYYGNGLGTESIISSSTASPATAPADMDIEYRQGVEDWYGIRWRMTDNDSEWVAPVRIGNPTLHRTLPLQNMMRRCALVNGEPKYISDADTDLYEDDTAVDYSTTDIYVEVPDYHFEATQDDDGWCELRLHVKEKVGKRSRKYYPGAWRANEETINGVVTLGSKCHIDFSKVGNHSSYDATTFAGATNFVSGAPRGGNQSSSYDSSVGNLIGRPRTSTTMDDFRTRAAANSSRHGIINYDCWCSIMRLFFVEYCTFDSQATFSNALTVLGFKQGGLTSGVTNANATYWNNLNASSPLIPCGLTKYLGNNTGYITVNYAAGTIAQDATSVNVPSYRGIENPFGDVQCITDGILLYGTSIKNVVYIATDETINNLAYVTPTGGNTTPTGYELLTDALPGGATTSVVNNGFIQRWLWNSYGMFVPIKYGTNFAIGIPDYGMSNVVGWKMLAIGGYANLAGNAGLGCFVANYDVDSSRVFFGTRLLYIPQD